jgi:hypothetical protein
MSGGRHRIRCRRAQSLYCAISPTNGRNAPRLAKRRNKAIAPYNVALQGAACDLTRSVR